MNVLYIAYNFPPETGAAVTRARYFVGAMRDAGHRVLVIAPLPNYPAGEVYPEWRGIRDRYDPETDVHHVWIRASMARSLTARVAPYVSYALSSTAAAIRHRFRGERFDAVVTSSPPLPAVAQSDFISRFFRAPLVLDLRDIWPDAGVNMGILRPGAAETRALGLIERLLLRRAHHSVVTADGDHENLLGKGVPESRITIITNGADTERFDPALRLSAEERVREYGGGGGFAAVYSGSFNFGMNDMDLLVALAGRIATGDEDMTLYLAGDGQALPAIREAAAASPHPERVRVLGSLPHDRLAPLVASTDVGVVPLRNVGDTGGNLPVKMFEFWSAGLPVLLGAHENSNTRPIFDRAAAGRYFEAGNPEAAHAGLIALRDASVGERRALGSSGRRFVAEHYSRRALAERFCEIVEAAAGVATGEREPAERS